MRLADFIDFRSEDILAEWEAFAATLLPSAAKLDPLALRDHAPQILQTISQDLRQSQNESEQLIKSQGLAVTAPGAAHTAAEIHGALRSREGFSMSQLISEYRALRATVLRLWTKAHDTLSEASAADDVTRFNEAVDQAIAESVDFFDRDLSQERVSRAKLDKALALSRARLEYASRLSNVGFWYCDLPFDVLQWDEQVKEHFFIEPTASVTIGDFYDRIHPEDREMTRSAIEISISSRNAYDIIYRTQHPSTGEVKWIRALGGTDYASDGSPIYFDGITVDVTAHKLIENRLAESEARHRGVITNMVDAFTLLDPDFNIVEVNETTCRLLGMTRDELIGGNHWHLFPGTYNSKLGQMYRQVLSQGEPDTLENYYVFPDGHAAWFDVRAFRVGLGVAVLFRDITQQREMIDALKNADQRKDEFLAMLGHELRNPLAPITTAGEILASIPEPNSAVKTATEVIRRQTKQMTRLIDDLLDIARITQGRIQLQKVPVDIDTVVAQAIETFESQLLAKQHRLNLSIEKTSHHHVEGDSVRLVQCVGNILSNAIKYTEPRGEIDVSVRNENEFVVITIADSGNGIPPELLPQVFNLFVQNHRTLDRSQGGLGVGLAVVKRLIEMQGGLVQVFSEGEGRGARFVIRLPRIAPSSNQQRPESFTLAPQRIMVIDDNVDAAECLVAMLQLRGHTTSVAYNANEALANIEAFRPDVMLIDIGLPEMDGYELVTRLSESTFGRRAKKIAVTGYGQAEDRQRALDMGFDEHLVKPVAALYLEQVIARLV